MSRFRQRLPYFSQRLFPLFTDQLQSRRSDTCLCGRVPPDLLGLSVLMNSVAATAALVSRAVRGLA